MNVVVGKSLDHRTPIFIDQMEYVVFRPYWNPPPSIIVNEIVPARPPRRVYLSRENMEIVASGNDDAPALPATPENLDAVLAGRLFVRQRPGPKNSLGLAKFIFPNARERLHARHARAGAVLAHAPRLQPRLHPAGGPGAAGRVGAPRPARGGRARASTPPCRASGRRGEPEAAADASCSSTTPCTSTRRASLHFVGDIYGHDRALDTALQRGYPYPAREAKAAGAVNYGALPGADPSGP